MLEILFLSGFTGVNHSLTCPVSSEEIELAVFQLGALKAPGPDGFPGFFYQNYWETVKNSTISAVKSFFESGFILKELNVTNLVLIPKSPSPETLAQFRPISLCNVNLKIITKILANRLKPILGHLISPQQSAFVPGRLIQDNILIAHEAFHHLKINRRGGQTIMAINLDFHKAYDRVEWDFLEAVMVKMGFHAIWIHWVMQCVSTVRFHIFANGEKRATVNPTRGLRQGDPLSPYLFLLVIDVLSKLLSKDICDQRLTGLKLKPSCPILSHLFFADDAILFLKANKLECTHVLKTLETYNLASGQLVNFSKSGVVFSSNANEALKKELSDFIGMPLLSESVKYLGLPAFLGRSKAEAYNFLIERTLHKLQGLKQKNLNQAGKEVMIKHVVQAIPSYAMACFALPKKFCDRLNSYVSNFWWGGDPENMGIHWMSWSKATQSKLTGGLGFQDFRAFNLAMLAKQGWRLTINPHSYWGQFMKGLYFPNTDFLHASKGRQPSWAWSSIIQGREILLKGVRWQVADGSKIQFWNDKWIPSSKDFKIHSGRPPDCSMEYVHEVINVSTKSWKERDIRALVCQEEADAILSIPISQSGRMDFLVWHPNPNGIYSVKSGYHLALEDAKAKLPPIASSSFHPPDKVWKFIWNLNIPQKLKHFWWKACSNLLATKENLHRRKCNPSPLCPICSLKPESVEHLLFQCEWTTAAWFGSNLTYKVDFLAVSSVMKWTIKMMEHFNSAIDCNEVMCKCVCLAWQIWKGRNDWVFNANPVDPTTTVNKARHNWKEFQNSRSCPRTQSVEDQTSEELRWKPPCLGEAKINCDVATKNGSLYAAVAVILRNDTGQILDGRIAKVYTTSSLQGEALAVRLAGSLALANHLQQVSIESDNQAVIKLCATENVPPWECASIIHDIKSFALSVKCSFSWIPRQCNRAANWLATHFLKGDIPSDWVTNPPPTLSSICNSDASVEVFDL